VIKAIRYPGNEIHVSEYEDTEDFAGPLPRMFDDSLAFVMRNLHKVQAGRGVNAPGLPEIPAGVFEELLVNALVHRDYLVSAPIRQLRVRSGLEGQNNVAVCVHGGAASPLAAGVGTFFRRMSAESRTRPT
jgi:hypothetical protein